MKAKIDGSDRNRLGWNLTMNDFRRCRRQSVRLFTSLCILVLTFCSQAWAQEPNVDELADHLVEQLKKAEKKHFPPEVLVIDFASRPGGIKAVGEHLANRLSDTFALRIGVGAIVERRTLHDYLLSGGISPFDLADRDISIWIGSQLGATVIIFGSVASSNEKLALAVDAYRTNDKKHLGSSKADIPLNDQLKEMVGRPLDWPASDVLVACPASKSSERAGDLFKAAGITMPNCVYCPNPDYTDEARAAKIQRNVKFDVVIDEQGKAKRIALIQGDTYGLATRALEAVRKWRFKPAMKDGKPVTVCVPIEVTFRLI